MKVRGMGDVTSPSENKELEDNLTDTINNTDTIVEKTAEKATEEVTKTNGPLDTQTKIVENAVTQNVAEVAQAPYKVDTKAVGKTKKEMSLFQERLKMLSIRVPGGYGFIQSAMASAVKGNMKSVMHHILGAIANVAFSLAAGLVRDTFNKLLSNPAIVNKEQASKFVKRVIGEANLGSLVGKASTMIATIGGKLGPFGQLFQRVANHILGVVTSKISIINRINNKMGSVAEILTMIDQLKPTMNGLIDQGIQASIRSSSTTTINVINQAIIQGKPEDLSKIADLAKLELASQLNVDANSFSFGNKTQSFLVNQSNVAPSNREVQANFQITSPTNTNLSNENASQPLTPEEEKVIEEYSEIVNKATQETLTKSLESVTATLIGKTLSYTTKETEQTAESTEELENELNLDAVGATAIVRGETYDCCAHLDNDGAEVHAGEDCLFQMTTNNIMNYVGNPEKTNQSTLILASDGLKTEINKDATKNNTITNSAEENSWLVNHGTKNTVISQSPDKIELKVGQNGSSLTMTENQIELKVGTSHILIKEGEISIGALNVNIGAGVTLAYIPTGFDPDRRYTCYFDAKNVESRNPINWKIDKTINFN
jgi:hypothetical protein